MPLILVDTHIWVWWTQDRHQLTAAQISRLREAEHTGIGVSAISCWEIGMLVAKGRLAFDDPAAEWVQQALAYPGIKLIPITPEIAVASSFLPGEFHGDPADRMLVATARALACPLMTVDRRVLGYDGVQLVPAEGN